LTFSRVRKAPIEVEFGTIHHADCWVPKPLSQTAHKRKKTMKTLVIFSFFAGLGMAQSSLPSRALTPGAVIRGVSARDVCVVGYSHRIRNVPIAEKRRVYGEYNLEYVKGADEVDHLIPLELGGSNTSKTSGRNPTEFSGMPTRRMRWKTNYMSKFAMKVCRSNRRNA
jgi:hypothetical protein